MTNKEKPLIINFTFEEKLLREPILDIADDCPIIFSCVDYCVSRYGSMQELLKRPDDIYPVPYRHLLCIYTKVCFSHSSITAYLKSMIIKIELGSDNKLYCVVNGQKSYLSKEAVELIIRVALSYNLKTNYKNEVKI